MRSRSLIRKMVLLMASNEQCKQFILKIAPLVVKYAKERGYHVASTIIAQACCESAYGTSPSGDHNYFGMKCGGAWKGRSVNLKTKEEYTVGTLTSIKDNFRCYDSFEDGVKGYFDFIAWSHYADLKKCFDYKSYAQTLKDKGYATSSTYVSTLCSIVEKWDLTKYDWEKPTMHNAVNNAISRPIIRYGAKGERVAEMQRALIAKGYSCGKYGADGNYGNATKEALGNYQADHKECGSVDYVCGPKTWASLLE